MNPENPPSNVVININEIKIEEKKESSSVVPAGLATPKDHPSNPAHPHTQDSIARSKTKEYLKKVGCELLQKYICIWFDPYVLDPSNDENYLDLKHLFLKCERAESLAMVEKYLSEINIEPVIILSCGGSYENIKLLVQSSCKVEMIIIFCYDTQKHMHYIQENEKVRGVVDSVEELVRAILKGYKQYLMHSHRFVELFDQRTFFVLGSNDEDFIAASIGIKKGDYEGLSLFYPLGFGAYKAEKDQWDRTLGEIKKISAENNFIDDTQKKEVDMRLLELAELHKKTGKELQERIIGTYTNEGLCYLFNYCMRTRRSELLEPFREYAYVLRGSMFMLGEPLPPTFAKPVYRGMKMKKEFVELWKNYKDKYIMLSCYTSTTLEPKIAYDFMERSEPQENEYKTLLTISFCNNSSQFVSKMSKFHDVVNGVYYPVDIHYFSAVPSEREVLFPPYYPLLVRNIEEKPNKVFHIDLLTPLNLSFGKLRESYSFLPTSAEVRTAIVERSIFLLNLNMLEILDLRGIFTKDIKHEESLTQLIKACVSTKLRIFNICYGDISDTPMKEIEKWLLKENCGLVELYMQFNKIGSAGGKAVGSGLKKNTSLLKLEIGS